jgi:hypothetical protein
MPDISDYKAATKVRKNYRQYGNNPAGGPDLGGAAIELRVPPVPRIWGPGM